MHDIDVSLIIPIHSDVKRMEELFLSLAKQRINKLNVEGIFIIDKCCPNDLIKLKKFCGLFLVKHWKRLIIKDVNFGNPDKVRQFALKFSSGRVIAFLDDDCRPYCHWLVNGVNKLEKYMVATGPVIHVASLLGCLCALMDFGEFQRLKPMILKNAPGCNLFIQANLLLNYGTLRNYTYGGDRQTAFLLSQKTDILYHPDLSIFHNPSLSMKEIWNREIRYGSVAWISRKENQLLPWGFLTQCGVIGLFIMAMGRYIIDFKRVWNIDKNIKKKIFLSIALIPFRIAYVIGIIKVY